MALPNYAPLPLSLRFLEDRIGEDGLWGSGSLRVSIVSAWVVSQQELISLSLSLPPTPSQEKSHVMADWLPMSQQESFWHTYLTHIHHTHPSGTGFWLGGLWQVYALSVWKVEMDLVLPRVGHRRGQVWKAPGKAGTQEVQEPAGVIPVIPLRGRARGGGG